MTARRTVIYLAVSVIVIVVSVLLYRFWPS
jgi:hypothetical protein